MEGKRFFDDWSQEKRDDFIHANNKDNPKGCHCSVCKCKSTPPDQKSQSDKE